MIAHQDSILILIYLTVLISVPSVVRPDPQLGGTTSVNEYPTTPTPLAQSFFPVSNGSAADVENETNQSQENASNILAKLSLPTPPGYRKWELPLHSTKKWRVYAFVSIFIRAVLEINEKDEEIVLDTDFGMQWVDWKVQEYLKQQSTKAGIGFQHRTLDSDVLRHIWKPDLFIDEMSSVQQTSVISRLTTLNFLGGPDGGDIVYSSRTTLKLRCEMFFTYYPADIQTCQFYVRSYSYNASKFDLFWNTVVGREDHVGVYLNDPSDPNFDIQISNVGPNGTAKIYIQETFDDFRSGNYTTLTFTLKARRKLSYHLVQTYLPSVLLILITWMCFLLPEEMVEARIGISMTTVLTLTAMFAAVRQQSPEVSYTMAIDVWCLFCITLVFIALLLFTITHWMTRKLKEETEHSIKYARTMKVMNRYAFLGFAMIFITFIITYWIWLLIFSDYYNWEPRPEFNGSPDQDDDKDDALSRYKYHDVDNDPYAKDAEELPTTTEVVVSIDNETLLDNVGTIKDSWIVTAD